MEKPQDMNRKGITAFPSGEVKRGCGTCPVYSLCGKSCHHGTKQGRRRDMQVQPHKKGRQAIRTITGCRHVNGRNEPARDCVKCLIRRQCDDTNRECAGILH